MLPDGKQIKSQTRLLLCISMSTLLCISSLLGILFSRHEHIMRNDCNQQSNIDKKGSAVFQCIRLIAAVACQVTAMAFSKKQFHTREFPY